MRKHRWHLHHKASIWSMLGLLLVIGLTFVSSGCQATTPSNTEQASEQESSEATQATDDRPIRVQFSFSPRYAPDNSEPYVVVGEYAKIPIGFNVFITSPGDIPHKYKIILRPMGSDSTIEAFYETSEATYNKDFDEHTVMSTDLKYLFNQYKQTITATCTVYDITEGEVVIFEGEASVPGVEAKKLEIAELNIRENTIDVAVTAYPDMKYEWRMNLDNELALTPQTGDMGWYRESFSNNEDTQISVTLYDDRGRFNNFLFVYPKN